MNIQRLFLILKEANANLIFLDDFQQALIADRTHGYKQHGVKINITAKQEAQLEEIAKKLFI